MTLPDLVVVVGSVGSWSWTNGWSTIGSAGIAAGASLGSVLLTVVGLSGSLVLRCGALPVVGSCEGNLDC